MEICARLGSLGKVNPSPGCRNTVIYSAGCVNITLLIQAKHQYQEGVYKGASSGQRQGDVTRDRDRDERAALRDGFVIKIGRYIDSGARYVFQLHLLHRGGYKETRECKLHRERDYVMYALRVMHAVQQHSYFYKAAYIITITNIDKVLIEIKNLKLRELFKYSIIA